LTIGLNIIDEGLPTLSRSRILSYVNDNYVCLQVRIRKDYLDRKLFFHHRPIAVTSKFSGSRITQAFEPVVQQTTNSIRSLGILASADLRPRKAEHLRTLVLAFRFETKNAAGRMSEQLEMAIVRGVESTDPLGLEQHLFVTTADRTKLSYLNRFTFPNQRAQCGISGNVIITDYDSSGLYPTKSAIRSYSLATRQTFSMDLLNKFCRERFEGGFAAKANQCLDAIIGGQLQPDIDSVPTP
jgi:hypothetical protein